MEKMVVVVKKTINGQFLKGKTYRTAPFLIGKPCISMGHFPVRYVSLPEAMKR